MSELPSPPVPFAGQCSAVYNNTLYTYQWNAFQSLPLNEGAKWSSQPMGVALNGSQCVLGKWENEDALIIVGGTTNDPSQSTYPGLQHFTFSSNQWASTPPGASVTQNRQMHSAAFLNDSNLILVYSGFQDDSFTNSSETFTISTQAPYVMQSFPAASPPGMSPILLPWNSSHAVMAGGSEQNRAVWLFSEATGWQELSIALPDSVKNMSVVQGAIIQGDNNAKALELFDMSTSPNTVSALLVQSGDSQPLSKAIQRGKLLSERQVDLSSWPSYNGSLAPTTQRSGFSLAQAPSGLVVIAGGEKTTDDPLCIFNQSGNSWISAKDFFNGQSANVPASSGNLVSSSTPSSTIPLPTAASAATSAPATSPASTSSGGLSDNSRIILGAVLGGLAGLAAILILLLLLLRYKKQKAQAKRGSHGFPSETKGEMGFDDSAAVAGFDKRLGSSSSKGSSKGGFFHKSSGSAESKLGTTISNPRLISDSSSPNQGMTDVRALEAISRPISPLPQTDPRDDKGWSQYFANSNSNTALDPNGLQEPIRVNSASRQTQYTTSNYDAESHTASIYAGDNDTVPLNPRSSGYPQSEESWEKSKFHPQSVATAYRPGTAISHVSEEEVESFLDPASSSSGTQAWDPVGLSDGQSQYNRRPASSVYADSINFPHPGDRVYIPGDSNVQNPAQRKNSTNNSWRQPSRQPSDPRGMRTMMSKDLTGSKPSSIVGTDKPPIQEDMSWLNLGAA